MEKLWLARIYARRGYVVLADRLYESMLPPPPKSDAEVALNQADAHLINEDWTGGARVLRRFLALEPKSLRGREMLAWALEASGDLEGELEVRRSLSDDLPDGRARSRLRPRARARGELRGGARPVRAARWRHDRGNPDATLMTSYNGCASAPRRRWPPAPRCAPIHRRGRGGCRRARRCRSAPAALGRSPGTTLRTTGRRTRSSGPNVLAKAGTVTGLGAHLLLARRSNGSLLVGVDARYATDSGRRRERCRPAVGRRGFHFGAQAKAAAEPVAVRARQLARDLNEQWNEAPITVHEGGTMSGATGRVYLYPKSRVVLIDAGAQVRQLSLSQQGTPAPPRSSQVLAWAGIDFNLWAAPRAWSAPRRSTNGWCAAPT